MSISTAKLPGRGHAKTTAKDGDVPLFWSKPPAASCPCRDTTAGALSSACAAAAASLAAKTRCFTPTSVGNDPKPRLASLNHTENLTELVLDCTKAEAFK